MFCGNTYKGERGYQDLLRFIIDNGSNIEDRTGVGCRSVFDAKIQIEEGEFPFSTIRSAPLRFAFEEYWMFLRGETQTKYLEEKGIFFWQGNTSREFLDNRGLAGLEEGDMGMAYGYQWRHFNKNLVPNEYVVDQLKETYKALTEDRYSRRILTTLWNPSATPYMALTSCHWATQFCVIPDKDGVDTLHLKTLNRSLDTTFGLVFFLQQARLYQMAMAKLCGLKVGTMVTDLSHVHIYNNAIEYALEVSERELGVPGKVEIIKELNTLEDLVGMTWGDIKVTDLVVNKKPFKNERPPMAV